MGACEPVGAETLQTGLEIRLSDNEKRIRKVGQPRRIDVKDQNTFPIFEKQALVGVINDKFRPTKFIAAGPWCQCFEIRLGVWG